MIRVQRPVQLSLVVPAYNEAQRIEFFLHETYRTLPAVCEHFEIIVIDDGSTDDTFVRATQMGTYLDDRVHVIRNAQNLGKGASIRHGLKLSKGELVAFLDADLDLHPSLLKSFLIILNTTGADAVIGSKWHPDSNVAYPWQRRILSLLYFGLVWILFGLPTRDTQTGIKLFRADCVIPILETMTIDRFAFDIELLIKLHLTGCRIVSAPISMSQSRKLQRLNVVDALVMGADTLRLFYSLRLKPIVSSLSGLYIKRLFVMLGGYSKLSDSSSKAYVEHDT